MSVTWMVLAAFIVAALTTHILRPVCFRIGLVDHPDGARKCHEASTPLAGGLGVLAGLVAAALMALGLGASGQPDVASVLLTAFPIVIAGVWDDYAESSPLFKLVAQFMAAMVMIYVGGVVVHDLGDLTGSGSHLLLGSLAVPLTVICIVGAINAINMIDGLDGLAGGVVLVALGWYGLAAAQQGALFETLLALVGMGAIGGFLLFNLRSPLRKRAAVFLGDSGSMLLGAILVWLSISLTQGHGRSFAPMMSVWVLGLPLLDTLSVIAIRLAQGRSPLSPDRNHIHHRLMRAGFNERQTIAILLLCACAFGAIGIGAWWLGIPQAILFYGSFTVYFLYLLTFVRRELLLAWVSKIRGAAPIH